MGVHGGDPVGARRHLGQLDRGPVEERAEREVAFTIERIAVAGRPDDGLAVVGAPVGEQHVGLDADLQEMFLEANLGQSIRRANSAITAWAWRIPGVRVWGCRLGQRIPPPAPPLARWAQAMWRK